MTDPSIPISAMAAVTQNLAFGITATTSFEPPFVLAKRFATLDHMTNGRIGWNIVTGYKKAAFRAIGVDNPIEHDERYAQADEYMEVLYKLWEGSWSEDATIADIDSDAYFDPQKIRHISHHGKYYDLETRFITSPSPQRTPFLFQAGTSSAGSAFAAKHAEAVFVSAHDPSILCPKVAKIKELAAAEGRDPGCLKFFSTFTPIIGRTAEEAEQKLKRAQGYASTIGGLVLFSGWTGIDISQIPLDQTIRAEDSTAAGKITSIMSAFTTTSDQVPKWTPRVVGEKGSIGGLGPVCVGTPEVVADEMERWIEEGGLDGFNVAYITTPGTFEDVVELLIPELRKRGRYPPKRNGDGAGLTARERIQGQGQAALRDDHFGSSFKYDSPRYSVVEKVSQVKKDVASPGADVDPVACQLG